VSWKIEGDYLENCNCEVLCPCITSPDNHGEYERCQVPLVCKIATGHYDDVKLDGLHFATVSDTPGVMSLGNWNVAYYIDERADEQQRAALETILTGKAGGVPEAFAGLVGKTLGIRYVPFTFTGDGTRWSASIPGILDLEIEGIVIPGNDRVLEIDHVSHPMGTRLPIAKAIKGIFKDFGFSWNNAGKNGHYARFVWEG
jgi:hypothetical protein